MKYLLQTMMAACSSALRVAAALFLVLAFAKQMAVAWAPPLDTSSRSLILRHNMVHDEDNTSSRAIDVHKSPVLPFDTSLCSKYKQQGNDMPVVPSDITQPERPLSRREALSRGILMGTSLSSAVTLPSSSRADTSNTASSASLLSSYDPNDYKTLPSLGRTVFPPPFLPPINNRATYRYSLRREAFALEQLLVFANVTATIRTNIIRLEDGGLWVSNPLWPTEEYCALLDELGPVKHVVLSTNALEHKAAMKQFVQKYPNADVWISPGQYGPFGECGIVTEDMNEDQANQVVKKAAKTMGHRVDGILPVTTRSGTKLENTALLPPWAAVFDISVLCVELKGNAGPVSECAFVHKPSSTLVVTDAVIAVPSQQQFPLQPIFATYFDKETITDPTFWPRTVLQAVFLPLRSESINDVDVYPGFEALKDRLVRAPILRAFADARAPDEVREWVNQICGLTEFDRIITAHFASPINAGPDLFRKAFAHLDQEASLDEVSAALPPISCRDWSTLDSLNSFIDDNKLGAPTVFDFTRGCKDSS